MRILDLSDLHDRGIKLSRVTIWRMENAGRFPRRVHVTPRCIGWREEEIDAYLTGRIAARDSTPRKSQGAVS
jgi:prophage regulatory protein